jgi:hypothetical protein
VVQNFHQTWPRLASLEHRKVFPYVASVPIVTLALSSFPLPSFIIDARRLPRHLDPSQFAICGNGTAAGE